jgi:molybdenum cofactor synthesis domain-containing protein
MTESPAVEPQLLAKILTVSDSVMAGIREDLSGPGLTEYLRRHGFEVLEHRVIADGGDGVANALSHMSYRFNGLIVTAGGTGFGPRDKTPEGTRRILDRQASGLAEAMRAVSPSGRLTRGVSGTRGRTLILNVPGAVSDAVEQLDAVIDVVPRALQLLSGKKTRRPE